MRLLQLLIKKRTSYIENVKYLTTRIGIGAWLRIKCWNIRQGSSPWWGTIFVVPIYNILEVKIREGIDEIVEVHEMRSQWTKPLLYRILTSFMPPWWNRSTHPFQKRSLIGSQFESERRYYFLYNIKFSLLKYYIYMYEKEDYLYWFRQHIS